MKSVNWSSLAILGAAVAVIATGAVAQDAPTMGKRAEHFFNKLDTNGDGVLSRSEVAGRPMLSKHFDDIDTNKDGVLSRDELGAARKKLAARHFAKLDTDNDGRISRAEAQAAPRLAEHFDAIDTNKDGYLSKDELKAAHQQHKAQ